MKMPMRLLTSGLAAAALLVLQGGSAAADNDQFDPVRDALVAAECTDCHMLYPVGLLPASTWSRMIKGLNNHFGENASVDPATALLIEAYLTANAPKGPAPPPPAAPPPAASPQVASPQVASSQVASPQVATLPAGTLPSGALLPASAPLAPLRITKLEWFVGDHDGKILSPANMARYKAKSAANCKACHKRAEQGDFD